MNIIVCIKQVPDTTEIKIDPITNTLIRTGVPSIVNPFDTYALEIAVRLKEKHGGKVTVISMGPEQAKEALRTCLSVGADKAYLLSDRAFGGSDTLATSYILSKGIKLIEETEGSSDVILCGKQAIDGDTAQVGPEIAEHLNIPQITYASQIEIINESIAHVIRESDMYKEVREVKFPFLATVIKNECEPRYANIKSKLAARKAEIPIITTDELQNIDKTKIGLKGSPTKVRKTFSPNFSKEGKKIFCEEVDLCTNNLVNFLKEKNIL